MSDPRTIRVALMLLVIFAAGGFCGWWIGRNSEADTQVSLPQPGRRTPMQQKEFMLNEFTRELQLTEDQRARVSRIMDQWAQDAQRANAEMIRTKQAILAKYSPQVRTNLNAEQQKTFDRMMEQTERRHRRMMQNQ
jgi:uncharacterized membrane protein